MRLTQDIWDIELTEIKSNRIYAVSNRSWIHAHKSHMHSKLGNKSSQICFDWPISFHIYQIFDQTKGGLWTTDHSAVASINRYD